MDHEKWDEEKIESYLKQLPPLEDNRSTEAILNRLKADNRLQESRWKRRKSFTWIATAIAVATIFLVMNRLPKMDDRELTFNQAFNTSIHQADMVSEEELSSVEETNHLLLEEAFVDDVPVQVQVTSDGHIIPVTFVLSKTQVAAEFLGGDMNNEQLFAQYANEIEFGSLGFDSIAHVGEPMLGAYFKYRLATGQMYFIPIEQVGMTAEEALLNMAEQQADEKIESVLPKSTSYHVQIEEGIAFIQFQSLLDLTALDREDALMLIEGFMLTAEQFDLQIQFEQILPETYAQYDLTKPLPKPVASNPMYHLYQ